MIPSNFKLFIFILSLPFLSFSQSFLDREYVLMLDSSSKIIKSPKLRNRITELDLSNYRILKEPNEIKEFPNLKTIWLNIEDTKLAHTWYKYRDKKYRIDGKTELQKSIETDAYNRRIMYIEKIAQVSDFTSIKKLELSKAFFEDIPSEVNQMINLFDLDLSGNKLLNVKLPDKYFSHLQFLNLELNYINPKKLVIPKHLITLNVSNNQFWKLNLFFFLKCRNVENLLLSGNTRVHFKLRNIRRLKKTKNLILSNCNLEHFDIKMKNKLDWLDLGQNNIRKVNPLLFLKTKNINLNKNNITQISILPENNIILESLNIQNNPISKFTINEKVIIEKLYISNTEYMNDSNFKIYGQINELYISNSVNIENDKIKLFKAIKVVRY